MSIITVCFNSEKYLEQTIQSVINQTYDNIEYIIVDGGSTDSTLDIIRKYKNWISHWISEPDKNMYDAINKGLDLISGEYWAVLNSDDYYLPETVQRVVDYFSKHPDKEVVTGDVRHVDAGGNYLYTRRLPKFNVRSMIRMKTNAIIAHPSTFLHRSVIDKVGKFNINYPVISDYDFLIRVGLTCSVGNCRRVLVTFRYHEEKLSLDESRQVETQEHREEIIARYSEQCDVRKGLVWWDYLRVRLANPSYFLRKRFQKLRENCRRD